MGLSITNPSTTVNSKLLVTKSNTAGDALLGSTNVTGNNLTTSWGQVTASLSADTVVTKVSVYSSADRALPGKYNTVEIAIGGAGSEVSIVTEPFAAIATTIATNFATTVDLSPPVRIASGQRVAARATTTDTMNAAQMTIALYGVPYANLEGN